MMLLTFTFAFETGYAPRSGCSTVSSITFQERGGRCGQPAHTSPQLSPTSAPPRPHCLSLLLRPSPLHHLCSLTSRASSLFRPAPASLRRAHHPLPPRRAPHPQPLRRVPPRTTAILDESAHMSAHMLSDEIKASINTLNYAVNTLNYAVAATFRARLWFII